MEADHPYNSSGSPIEVTVTIVENEAKQPVSIFMRLHDLTHQRELENQLSQSQKMESIGTLAGGIAHDFNNILSAIMGYTELALDDIDKPEILKKDLEEVQKGSLRAKELVQQILTFSRKGDQELRPLRAQLIVKEALKLLRSSIPTTIEIKHNIDPDCETILADPSQVHQIVMNLCTNAYHAMRKSGGVLEISMQNIQLGIEDISEKINIEPGSYILLSVSDSGIGIPRNVLQRIFEPYYTTKEKGEGTGLGLAVVHGIISRLHGHISVDSEPGKGTTISVYLPTISAPMGMKQEKVCVPLPKGHERILLVDDDADIVQLTQKVLTKLGYKVTGLTNSLETLLLFKQNPEEFDLILTDMTMPNMTGEKLAQQVLAIRPGMPIVLCTGYSEDFNEEKARALGIASYLMKPVSTEDLALALRKILDCTK
ncbi:MAG: ATP-binding protein [Desulfobulbaceae bacterium]|nr:ATP-binding protein [Desulfobulbaceae bacterium]